MGMTKPTVHDVHAITLAAARCQIATSKEAKAIVAAGLEEQMANLIHAISANAANPIVQAFEDYYDSLPVTSSDGVPAATMVGA